MQPQELRRFERDLYRVVSDDGVWDLVLGIGLVSIGAAIALGRPAIGPLVATMAIPIGQLLKRRIGHRAGYVRFRPARVHRFA